ncbi:hypothetical protein PC128_g17745 [Phytophthora cactorum]|nr:hypothetical protein PC128_g17745 [Phytophthora cactorum]
MVLRAVKLIVQASLLLQVLQCSASVNGVEVNENFQNTPLSTKDKLKLGTVSAANIPDSQDENIKKQEERGFFDWFSDDDDTPAPASPASGSTPATETGEFATTTPIPGTAARPSTSSLMSKYGSMLGEFTKNSETASEADGSTAGAGSSATTPKTKKPKKPAAAATSATSSGSTSGSDATETTPKRKRTKKRVVAAASASGSEASASGSEATPKTKKPTTKKTKKPVAAAVSSSESEAESGSDDLSDLLSGSTASGSEDLSDLLGSSAGSGSEADMSALLGSGSNDALTALLGSGVGGSGSMLSFEDFMKEYGSMFGSGSSAIDLFGDSSTPQNNTVNDDDILLGELYGGKEHGDAFSDIKNIKFGQMILNITVRGQERVDSIGITVMTQEAVGNLVHGGEGGTEGFIEPTMGDTIDSVEVHWDKNKGKTCIFYLKMTTSGGKTIATGTKTANSAVMKPPKGYQLAGFYGRASSSGIFCIGGIWTKQTATDLAVTDVMAITSKGSPDIYNYETTIRNWVGPLEVANDNACYQKRVDVSSQGMCPSGFNKDDDKAANFALTCAINVVNAVKSLIYYLRYKQTTIPTTDTEKLMDKAFQMQIVILDLPIAICSCLGIKIPPKLQFSATILAVVSAIVMMAVMIGEAIFASSNNVMLMLRESGALNNTALDGDTIQLDTFLNTKNGTCGYEMKTLTNRVMGKVYEIRNNTPNAAQNDVRVQLIEDGTTDMGKNVVKKEKALEYANLGDSIVNCPIMVRAEEEDDTMRPCGCHAGRPCTCEMGKKTVSTDSFSCGVCVNCRLDARERSRPRKRSSGPRRCLKSAEYFVELEFDRVVLRGDCVFRMRKPDWNVADKTPLYNQLHQMRLGMTQTRAISLATIDSQKKMRIKLTSDLRKAEDAIKKLETVEQDVAMSVRRMTKDQLCVDSDAFDSFSKQLITAQTLLPDLKVRLEKANATIFTEQQNIKIIREYVRDFAIRKLQSSIRAFFRFRRWKEVLKAFHEDVRLSATLEIQAIWRMFTAKKLRQFLASLLHGKVRSNAANVIRRFSLESIEAKGRKMIIPAQEDEVGILARKQESVDALFGIIGRVILNDALATWKGYTLDARIVAIRKKASAILIQRVYRGFRDRVYLKRIKIRSSLTDRVGALVDKFIVSGDFWGFILEIDADYRRFIHKIAEEEQDAATFMSTVIRQRKLDEDHMMQDWFTASALQNPLVSGIDQVTKMYSEECNSSGTSVSQAMLQSPLVEDLVALSPNKTKTDIFPPNFPPKVIRQAMAKGFALNEVIAVMRGLQAQRKDIEDADLVLSTLQKRSLLMTNPWTSERVLRESRSLLKALVNSIPVAKPVCKPLKKAAGNRQANSFISANLLESIPGGMNAPIARLLLVAGLSCYDPGSRGEKGRFIPSDDRKSELFQAYLNTESPLVKIRTEQQTMEAVKPFLNILLENRCYTAYDILYNVRGIGELISWNIPGPFAKGIYSVIREIHAQSTHISKRNIIREVRVSADFERFLKSRERKREKLSSPDSKPAKKDSKPGTPTQYPEPEECSALIQVKYRLETEVLGLPLQDISISACELLFKAAFLADIGTEDPTTTDTYRNFLQSLLELQAAGDTETMKELIAARVARAKAIADGHTSIFQVFAVSTASDLVVRWHFMFRDSIQLLTA